MRASVFDGRPRDVVFDGEVIAIVNAVRRGGEVRGDTGSGLGGQRIVYARIVEGLRREDGLWPTTGRTTDALPWTSTTS